MSKNHSYLRKYDKKLVKKIVFDVFIKRKRMEVIITITLFGKQVTIINIRILSLLRQLHFFVS
jgi:hypothetical protein